MKPHLLFPLLTIFVLVGLLAVAQYGLPRGPVVTAFYPAGEAFTRASNIADAILADSGYTATVMVSSPEQYDQLRKAGAILFDTQGVSTCLQAPPPR